MAITFRNGQRLIITEWDGAIYEVEVIDYDPAADVVVFEYLDDHQTTAASIAMLAAQVTVWLN